MQTWQLPAAIDPLALQQLKKEVDLPEIILSVLMNRGYRDPSQLEQFLHPDLTRLTPPSAFYDLDKAVARIEQAIDQGEKITIYGDYDADGVSSVALLVDTFLTLGVEVDYYIPNRFTDGYGPNMDRYQEIVANGTQLLITVDNGITGVDEVAYAQKHGVDVIVTDHHDLPPKLPEAYAIIHARHPQSTCSFGYYAGVGVAFYLAWGLLGELPLEMTDLVAIGTVADVMPLKSDNRLLVAAGLQQMQQQGRPGLTALAQQAKISLAQANTRMIGFNLAPRLNSLGRLASGRPAVELLTTLDIARAQTLAEQTEQTNRKRRELVQEVYQAAVSKITDEKPAALVVAGEDWPEGVLGIVASRLVDDYHRPTLVLSINQKTKQAKGSGRSVGDFDLFAALNDFRDHFLKFGGHAGAVGLTLQRDEINSLRTHLQTEAQKHIEQIQKIHAQQLDYQLKPAEVKQLTPDFVLKLDQVMGPTGEGNPEPIFDFSRLTWRHWQAIGKTQQTLKGSVNQHLEAISFHEGQLARQLTAANLPPQVIGTLAINQWQNQRKVQVNLLSVALDPNDKKVSASATESVKTLTSNKSQPSRKLSNDKDHVIWAWQNKHFDVYDYRQTKFTRQLLNPAWHYVCFSPSFATKLKQQRPDLEIALKPQDLHQQRQRPVMFVDLPSQPQQLSRYLDQLDEMPLYFLFYLSRKRQEQLQMQVPQLRQFFKQLYQQKMITQDQFAAFAKHCQLTPAQFQLGIQVFSELNFVRIDKERLWANRQADKRNLIDSATFRKQQTLQQSYRQLGFGSLSQVLTLLKKAQ